MVYQVEISSIDDFPAWSGGKETLEDVRAADKIDELDALAEAVFRGSVPTSTEINDWLWFDSDSIYSALGLDENGEPIDE